MIKIMTLFLISILSINANALENDKEKHLIASTIIGGASEYIFDDYKYSLSLCATIGLGKELYDEYDYGGFSSKDLAYDLLGCGLGVIIGQQVNIHITPNNFSISYNYKF